ncbi:MAG: type II toxin-antitoxin system VapC family toxin [Rhabdochlamydiaceae bacterium]
MKYVDSNIFIYPVVAEHSDAKAHGASEILIDIAEGRIDAFTSCLTWDEVVWNVRKYLGREAAVKEGRNLLEFPNLKMVAATNNVLNTAQELMEKHGLKPRDAIHMATCIEHGAKELISDDSDFDVVKPIKRIPPSGRKS